MWKETCKLRHPMHLRHSASSLHGDTAAYQSYNLQASFYKRATNYKALLQKVSYEGKKKVDTAAYQSYTRWCNIYNIYRVLQHKSYSTILSYYTWLQNRISMTHPKITLFTITPHPQRIWEYNHVPITYPMIPYWQ